MKEHVITSIKQVLATTLNISQLESITLESKLRDDLGLDSMSSLTFLIALEESITGFVVNPDTLESDHLETVASITDYVLRELPAEKCHLISETKNTEQSPYLEEAVYA